MSSKGDSCTECFKKSQCLAEKILLSGKSYLGGEIINNIIYRPGDYIYRQGEVCKHLFVIKTGAVKSQIGSIDGIDQIIGFHFSTEVLGFDGLDCNKYVSSVIVLENSIVCAFPRQLVEMFCAVSPDFQRDLIARLSREITHEHQFLMLINKNTAEQRVALFLLDLSIRLGGREVVKIDIILCMSRADIANYLGLVPETISRILSRFELKGVIAVRKKKLKIINMKMLNEYSHRHCCYEIA